jgi:hypothetical protein
MDLVNLLTVANAKQNEDLKVRSGNKKKNRNGNKKRTEMATKSSGTKNGKKIAKK